MTSGSDSFRTIWHSPVGYLSITADEHAVRGIVFMDEGLEGPENRSPVLDLCIHELQLYFDGILKNFTVPVHPAGTSFQHKVWQLVSEVPYGNVRTYGEIARKCGDMNLSRAVGTANGSNPIPVIIPCHRIIGQNGKLIGYGGGLWRKEWLLRHEARYSGHAELF